LPQIPSHEGAGTVAAVGPEAPKGLKVGDRVAVAGHYHPCCTFPNAGGGGKDNEGSRVYAEGRMVYVEKMGGDGGAGVFDGRWTNCV